MKIFLLLFLSSNLLAAGTQSSLDLYYQGQFKASFQVLKDEIKDSKLSTDEIEIKLDLARELLAQCPDISTSEYVDLLNGLKGFRETQIAAESLFRNENTLTIGNADELLKKLSPREDKEKLQVLAVIFERKMSRNPQTPEWIFLTGKTKAILTHSGSFYFTRYIEDENSKDKYHLQQALLQVSQEHDFLSPHGPSEKQEAQISTLKTIINKKIGR